MSTDLDTICVAEVNNLFHQGNLPTSHHYYFIHLSVVLKETPEDAKRIISCQEQLFPPPPDGWTPTKLTTKINTLGGKLRIRMRSYIDEITPDLHWKRIKKQPGDIVCTQYTTENVVVDCRNRCKSDLAKLVAELGIPAGLFDVNFLLTQGFPYKREGEDSQDMQDDDFDINEGGEE